MTPNEFALWLANSKPMTVIFEACSTSNYWKQRTASLGHDARLISPNLVASHESQIYGWRKNSKKDTSTSQREQELAAEVAKLKRQLAEQAEELEIVKKATYFSKNLK